MSATLLGRTSGTTINSIEAGPIFSKVVLENVFMQVIEDQGRGITQSFSTDVNAGQIKVLRVLPLTQRARRLGGGINGGNFNSANAEQPATTVQMLNVLDAIDGNIDIADMSQQMIDVNLLDQEQKNVAQLVARTINAGTVASKVQATLGEEIAFTTYSSGDEVAEKFLTLSALLDDGDIDNGVQYFPRNDRCFVVRASFQPKLLKAGVYSLGGANYGYEMQAKGVISPNAERRPENGYIGEYNGIPLHIAASGVWSDAEDYLGLPAGELDDVLAYCSSGMANARGLAHDNSIKIIDCPNGPGIRLQPRYRFGFASWYGKGNQFLANNTFNNPYTKGKTVNSDFVATIVPPASRQFATVTWSAKTPTITPTTGSTVSVAKAKPVASSTTVDLTIQGIVAATGSFLTMTSGSAITFTSAGTYYWYHLVFMSDGTVIAGRSENTFTNS